MRMICVSELIGNTFGALFDPKKKIIKKKIVRLDIFCITARVLSKFFWFRLKYASSSSAMREGKMKGASIVGLTTIALFIYIICIILKSLTCN